jgi:hypothetical protein
MEHDPRILYHVISGSPLETPLPRETRDAYWNYCIECGWFEPVYTQGEPRRVAVKQLTYAGKAKAAALAAQLGFR